VKKKILLIDDDKDFGLLLTGFFIGKNFEVILAHTLEEGMAVLERERPDYIFLDNTLPDGLGWGKATFIKTKYPSIHLNLISAWAPGAPADNVRVLEKPIHMDDFMACLQYPSS